MQKFFKKVFEKSKKLFNLINIFDQNKRNFDLELYLYKALEERNITLNITNEDTPEEVINILLKDFNEYKEKIGSLKNQQTKLAENNFKLKSEIEYLRKQCDSYKTELDALKSQ